ncbi:argininosuccinate lyase [Acephala macrosclerotiorum]|nr:argininosuccinate lyase [Acephala macrosclerotiorum]
MAAEQLRAPGSKPGENMLLGGRFTGGLDPLMVSYNQSIYFDRTFHTRDILGSIAWARANHRAGILSTAEFKAIESGLNKASMNIHTANERGLGEIIGKDIGGKLHTGRIRDERIETFLVDFLKVMAARAEQEIDIMVPHWMLSYGMAFAQDLDRFHEVIFRVNQNLLGAGALTGNCFGVDCEAMAKELGFNGLLWNLMGAVSSWAEDLIIYSTGEFAFVRLADAYSTGSSLMPQKKNPDSLELLRGKSGRAFGQMAGLMMTVKGIPSTYNKDPQETVEPMLDHVKTVSNSIQIATGVLSTATDLADYPVKKGVPFLEAHHISSHCHKMSYSDFQNIDSRFKEEILKFFNMNTALNNIQLSAVLQKARVLEQVKILKKMLK